MQLDCPPEALFAQLFDPAPAEELVERISTHTDRCERCRSLLVELARSHTPAANSDRSLGSPTLSLSLSESSSAGPLLRAAAMLGATQPGMHVGRYVLERTIGFGGMGVVYAAFDPELHRQVAIKLLRADLSGSAEDQRQLLKREAQAMARLSHPNVVHVHEVGSMGDQLFVVMELVDGITLREWLPLERRSWRTIVRAFVAAGTGLLAAHRADIIHRDFKPDNVLVDKEGRIRVTDFGLARVDGGGAIAASDGAAGLQAATIGTRAVAGTPAYMAPEQLRGGVVSARSDVFSFCVALYEALFGERPFAGRTVHERLAAVDGGRLRPPPKGAAVPAWLGRALERGLAADPDARWPSMAELLRTLDKDRRRTARILTLASGVCVAVTLAFVSGSRLAPTPVERPAEKLVAMLDLDNRSSGGQSGWLSTAIGELTAAEVQAAGGPRFVPGDDVARMERELRLAPVARPPAEELRRVRENLRVDFVVAGDYVASAGGGLELTLRLLDAATGRELAVAHESGRQSALLELGSQAGRRLRRGLGMPALAEAERRAAQRSLPATVEAARAYTRGLLGYRSGDLPQARDALVEAVRLDRAHAQSHLVLARVWKGMGYFQQARDEAQAAIELSAGLPRDDQLSIEAASRDLRSEWDRAIDVGRAIVVFYPDRIYEWLRLINMQARARRGKDCVATIEALHQRPLPDPDDPNIAQMEAWCYQVAADFPRSRASAERAASLAERRGARLLAANAHNVEAYALTRMGQGDRAIERYTAAIASFHELGERNAEARALNGIGIVYNERRDSARARPYLERALATFHDVGNRAGEMMAANNLANASDTATARALYRRALALADDVRDHVGAALAGSNLARLDGQAGDVEVARRALESARQLAHDGGDRHVEGSALMLSCELLPRTDDLAAATTACDETGKLWAQTGEVPRQVELAIDRAALLVHQRRFAEAGALARKTSDDAHKAGMALSEAEAQLVLTEAAWRMGRMSDARQALARADQVVAASKDAELAVTAAVARVRLDVAAGTGDWRALAARIAPVAERARAAGQLLDWRDAELARGQALRRAHDPRAGAILDALAADAQAKGDLLIVHAVQALR